MFVTNAEKKCNNLKSPKGVISITKIMNLNYDLVWFNWTIYFGVIYITNSVFGLYELIDLNESTHEPNMCVKPITFLCVKKRNHL